MLIDQLAIIGVGLIGGSLARALRRAKLVGHVRGCNRNEASLKKAVELNVIDDYSLKIGDTVRDADVVVIGTPLSAAESLLPEIVRSLKAEAVLTDVGSVKGGVVNAAKKVMGDRIAFFVPGHPVAGTEKSGVEASFAELFVDHRVILTPLKQTDSGAYKLIARMWRATGAEVVELEVEHHDEVLAATSHLPHILAYALVDCLAGMQQRDELFQYAAGGFADFTRIASSSPEMWHDICFSNRDALLNALDIFSKHIDRIKSDIEQSNSGRLLDIFKRAKQARDKFAGTRK